MVAPSPAYYYLVVGASEADGVQPTPKAPTGAITRHGYANDVRLALASLWPGIRRVNLACPAITTEEALHGGSACRYGAGSQTAAAVDFLKTHRSSTVLVTVDLGFNDIAHCLRLMLGPACATEGLASLPRPLDEILLLLRQAAGPQTVIVGLEHNDPFVADYITGARGEQAALSSIPVIASLNAALATAYLDQAVAIADVPAYFGAPWTPERLWHGRRLPGPVAVMCALSWMCVPPPLGPDLHPNDRGYQAIAAAILSALRGQLRLRGFPVEPRPPA